MRVELDDAVMLFLTINGFGDLGACPNEYVGVPDGGHSEFRVCGDLDLNIADLVFNRGVPWFFRKGEERPLHRVFLIPDREVGAWSWVLKNRWRTFHAWDASAVLRHCQTCSCGACRKFAWDHPCDCGG